MELRTRSVCGLERVTVHISGWEEMATDAYPEAKPHGMRPLSLFINCISPLFPSSQTSDIFHPICTSSLNSEHLSQGMAPTSSNGHFTPSVGLQFGSYPSAQKFCFSWPWYGKGTIPSNPEKAGILVTFCKALPEKGCQSKTVLQCQKLKSCQRAARSHLGRKRQSEIR